MKKILLCLGIITLYFSSPAQQWQMDSLQHNNVTRKYKTYKNTSDTIPYKLVLMLHGLGGTMHDIDLTNWTKIADTANVVLVSPEALDFNLALVGSIGNAWNSGINLRGTILGDIALNPTIDDVDFLNMLLDSIITRENIDTQSIFVGGFSNGGFMTQRLLCETPERFRKAASMSGTKALELTNCSTLAIPIAHFHGTNDPTVNWDGIFDAGLFQAPAGIGVDSLIKYWTARNNVSTLDSFLIGQPTHSHHISHYKYTGTNNQEVSLYKIHNGAHEWFNYEQTQQTFDLALEVWNFFNGYSPNYNSILNTPYQKEITLYPNPTKDYITIVSPEVIAKIVISNIQGQQFIAKIEGNKIDLSNLVAQTYILDIHLQNGYIQRKLIIKE